MSSVLSPRRLPRVLVSLLCLGLVGALVTPSGASAQDDVEGLRARAASLADQLEDLEREASIADEDYLQTLDQLETLHTEINTTQDSIAEAQARVDEAESQASEFLVAKYMDAGSSSELIAVSTADVNQSVNQQVLLGSLRGNREQLSDELAASRADLDDRKSELADKQSEVESVKADQQAAKERLDSSVDRSKALYDQANGELQQAIEAERQRREAEAARRAAAEAAEREAAQAAAAQARATQQAAAQQAAASRTTVAPAPARRSGSSTTAPAPTTATAPAPAPWAPAAAGPAPAPPPPPPPPPTSGGAAGAIAAAKTQIGRMYRYGGSSPSTGFDCSGLMMWSWAQVGVGLPRSSGAQLAATQRISMSQIQPGDLVFYGSPVHHVGMYVGGGMMIDSPRTGKPVSIRPVGYVGSVSGVGRVR